MKRITRLSRSIAGRVALVTGAASGMGRATAQLFADEGASVAVTDLDLGATQKVVDEIRDAGGTAHAFALDVSNPDRIAEFARELPSVLGELDILVNNAGVGAAASLDSPDDQYERAWSKSMSVNLKAHVLMVRAFLSQLQRNGEGRIINIASTEGLGATPGAGPYSVAKHGVIGLTRSMAVDLGGLGVTVNCICPGPILTGMTEAIPPEHRQKFARRRVPLRRYGDPEEVAHMTLSLALPAASFLNGAIIPVDGGMKSMGT